MRVWLLILMIAFTPLRAWAGDVMALEMAAQHLAVAKAGHGSEVVSQPASRADTAGAPHAGCAGHANSEVAVADSEDPQVEQVAGHCPTCSACQVCSSAALALQVRMSPVVPMFHGMPMVGGSAFASAEPARGFKPPIS